MISAFVSYAHNDEKLKDRFIAHLASLLREGIIGVWHDRMLRPGEHIDKAIETELAAADLVILLISPDFIHSNYCTEKEMQRAFARAKADSCAVVCVILEPCQWSNIPIETGGRLGDFLALPRDARPVTEWPNQNTAFSSVVAAIRDFIIEKSGSQGGNAAPDYLPPPNKSPLLADIAPARQPPRRIPSGGLNIPRQFTDFDRDTFVDHGFETIALAFKERLKALEQENQSIKSRFNRVDAHTFVGSVYVNGNLVGGAKVFRDVVYRHNSINLGYDLSTANNSSNEWISVETDDKEIFFKAMGMAHVATSGDRRKLNPDAAADYLWSVMMSQLQARIRSRN